MAEEPKNIGELFKQSFKDMEEHGDNSDWLMLKMKLERLKFFRFGLTYFNIYYASIIALTFTFSSAVWVNEFLIHKTPQELVTTDENNNTDILSDSTNDNDYIIKDTDNIEKYIPKKASQKKSDTTTTNTSNLLSVPSTDSSHFPTILPAEKKEDKPKVREKKTIYITKQDTLIVVDTVRTSKKRKK